MPRSKSPLDARIGERLRQVRIKQRLSQTELGLALGISFQQVQKYEKGTNKISASRLIEICKKLDIPAADLMGGVEMQQNEIMSNAALKFGFDADKLPVKFHAPLRELMGLIITMVQPQKVRRPRAAK